MDIESRYFVELDVYLVSKEGPHALRTLAHTYQSLDHAPFYNEGLNADLLLY